MIRQKKESTLCKELTRSNNLKHRLTKNIVKTETTVNSTVSQRIPKVLHTFVEGYAPKPSDRKSYGGNKDGY